MRPPSARIAALAFKVAHWKLQAIGHNVVFRSAERGG